jgi:dephospho-CoA kinase
MKLVGLTGGIGSGKTTVASMFADLGAPVYNSDREAKRLMNESGELRDSIIELLGETAYEGGVLNRSYVASRVFADKALLRELNEIVHPVVRRDFKAWASRQSAPYVLQEAAILFENGSSEAFDAMILVTAPKKIRTQRIKSRDGLSEKAIKERMKSQWPEKKKKALASFVIQNTDLEDTRAQVLKIHQLLLK